MSAADDPDKRAAAARLAELLEGADVDALDTFLAAHALGTVAGQLVALMTPGARVGFFASMRARYPEAAAAPGGPVS